MEEAAGHLLYTGVAVTSKPNDDGFVLFGSDEAYAKLPLGVEAAREYLSLRREQTGVVRTAGHLLDTRTSVLDGQLHDGWLTGHRHPGTDSTVVSETPAQGLAVVIKAHGVVPSACNLFESMVSHESRSISFSKDVVVEAKTQLTELIRAH